MEKDKYKGNIKYIVTIKDSILVSKLSYDVQGNLIEKINFEDSTTTKYINTYQGEKLVAKESELIVEGRSYLSKTTYDDLGTKIIKSYIDKNLTGVEIFQYDGHFNLIEKNIYKNGSRGRCVENSYNDNDRLISQVIILKDSTLSQLTTFNYNDAGYLIESHIKTYSQSGLVGQTDYYFETVIDRNKIRLHFNDSLGNTIRTNSLGSVHSGDIYGVIQKTLKDLEYFYVSQFDKKGRPLFYFYTESETSNINYRARLNYNKKGLVDEITITKSEYDETYFQYCGETKIKILYEKKKMIGSISYFNGLKTGEETYITSYNRSNQLDTLVVINGKRQYGYSFNYWKNGALKELTAYNKGTTEPHNIKHYNPQGLLEYEFNHAYSTVYKYDLRGNCIYLKRQDVHYLENVHDEKKQIVYYE